MANRLAEIVTLISAEIQSASSSLKAEEFQPMQNSDASDDLIKHLAEKITALRAIRTSLEDLLS